MNLDDLFHEKLMQSLLGRGGIPRHGQSQTP